MDTAAPDSPVTDPETGDPIYAYPLFVQHSAFARGTPHAFASRDYKRGLCPVAEEVLETCLMLTINEGYSDEDLDQTIRAFRRVATWLRSKRGARA